MNSLLKMRSLRCTLPYLVVACSPLFVCCKKNADAPEPTSSAHEPGGGGSGASAGQQGTGAGTGAGTGSASTASEVPSKDTDLAPGTGLEVLHYLGSEGAGKVRALGVFGDYVYWAQSTQDYVRAMKDGTGEPEAFYECSACEKADIHPAGQQFYVTGGSSVHEFDFQTKQARTVELPWSLSSAALHVGDDYVYVGLRGCPAIVRIDRQTLTFDEDADIYYIDDIPAPGRGYVALTSDSRGLYCGGPSELFAIDAWDQPPRKLIDDTEDLFGLTVVDGWLYWMGQESSAVRGIVGRVATAGGLAQRGHTPLGGGHGRLRYAASFDRLIHTSGYGLAIWTLDVPETSEIFELNLILSDIAVDSEFIFLGSIKVFEGKLENWITRLPLSKLVEGK